ncbi:MAG: acetyl-CoA acetyltransferase [Thermoplasmata archaeon]|nr:acetyl-CoA acetyltransferase [Thermoplasmata archaeon]
MRETWVVGAATTRFGRLPESAREAATRVSLAALDAAGMQPREIGHTFVSNCFGVAERQVHLGPLVNTGLGIPEVPSASIESACSSSSAGLHEAFVRVAGGFDDAVLVVGAERLSHLDTLRSTSFFAMGADYPFETRNGATFPGLYATIANAHRHAFGTKEEELGAIAVKNHANAARNPHAHFQKEISLATYLASPVIASPLRLYDCCPFSDGAAAVVVAARETTPRPASEPLVIRASARSGSIADLQDRPELTGLPATRLAAAKAFRQAGLSAKEVSFLEVHDCFTIAEILALEDLGFFPKGEAARAGAEGITARDGSLPVNPSGGLKAKGHPVAATGVSQVVEVFEQFNHRAGARQVPSLETALTHNVGATGGSCSVHLFGHR